MYINRALPHDYDNLLPLTAEQLIGSKQRESDETFFFFFFTVVMFGVCSHMIYGNIKAFQNELYLRCLVAVKMPISHLSNPSEFYISSFCLKLQKKYSVCD